MNLRFIKNIIFHLDSIKIIITLLMLCFEMKYLIYIVVIALTSTYSLSAQGGSGEIGEIEPNTEKKLEHSDVRYFYEPYPLETGTYLLQLGGSISLLPIPIIEVEFPVPAIDLNYKHCIFKNVSLVGVLSTNYYSNILHTGLQFNTNFSHFSIGVANHIGTFAGFINIEGQFDKNEAYAFFYMPIVRLGWRMKNASVSASLVASYIFKSETKISDIDAPGPQGDWNDFFCTVALEQPIFKETLLSIGLSFTISRTPYQAWLLFNTIDQYQYVPEFFFSFQL